MKQFTHLILSTIIFLSLFSKQELLKSQSHLESIFTTEGIGTVIGATDLLINEPLVNIVNDRIEKVEISEFESRANFGLKIGIMFFSNETSKNLTIPLEFRYSLFNFSATVPYFLNKKMKYSLKEIESSGIGDISVGVGYSNVAFSEFYYNLRLDTKLATGDDLNSEDGYLVPLGTGSMDFMFSIFGTKFITEKISIGSSFSYKLNGTSSKTGKINRYDDEGNVTGVESIKYDITNGNFLSLGSNLEYFFDFGLSLNSGIHFKLIGEGNTDKVHSYSWDEESISLTGLSNKQDASLVDLSVKATYGISIFDLSAGLKIPVYTKRNDDNLEDDRGISIFTKIDYSIF